MHFGALYPAFQLLLGLLTITASNSRLLFLDYTFTLMYE